MQLTETFLYASTTSDSGSTTATAGEKTHTLSANEIPSHNHMTGQRQSYASGNMYALVGYGSTTSSSNSTTSNTGGGQAHNNMPPYMRVYMWKRTA